MTLTIQFMHQDKEKPMPI